MTNSQIPQGWYPDPQGFNCERLWDGENWTSETRPMSILPNRPPPQLSQAKTGMDSTEKAILIFICVAVVLVALFSTGY